MPKKKELQLLEKIHDEVFHPQTGLKATAARVKYLTDDISVNGSKGLQPILTELYEVTATSRAKRKLQKAWNDYTKNKTFIVALAGALSDRKFLVFILIALLSYLGVKG